MNICRIHDDAQIDKHDQAEHDPTRGMGDWVEVGLSLSP